MFSVKITLVPFGLFTNTGSTTQPLHWPPYPTTKISQTLKQATIKRKNPFSCANLKITFWTQRWTACAKNLHFCMWWNLYKLQPEFFTNAVTHSSKKLTSKWEGCTLWIFRLLLVFSWETKQQPLCKHPICQTKTWKETSTALTSAQDLPSPGWLWHSIPKQTSSSKYI